MRLRSFVLALMTVMLASHVGGASLVSLREKLLSLPVSAQLGGGTTRPVFAQNAFSFQAANAPRAHQRPFSFGNRLFNTNWIEAPASVKSFDGLGPLFNRVSCSGCHTKDGRGSPPVSGAGPMDSLLLKISIRGVGEHGGPVPVPGYGDQLSERGINGVLPEGVVHIAHEVLPGTYGDGEAFSLRKPVYTIQDTNYGPLPADVLLSARVAPHVIGLGLLEAVPDETLMALADPADADGEGISGRVNRVWDSRLQKTVIGRFGWKAGQPDLINQNSSAAIGDIGLTTSLHPRENCEVNQEQCAESQKGGAPEISDEFLEKLTLYTATLAVPAQRDADNPKVVQGQKLFAQMQCSRCHFPTLQSGEHPLAEVSGQTFHPYTDLLLHDMGDGLTDGRPEFVADGREWRTPPLWGLGLVPIVNGHLSLLHDGRARGFAEAILWHGGEGERASEAFRQAPRSDRDALIEFLGSL